VNWLLPSEAGYSLTNQLVSIIIIRLCGVVTLRALLSAFCFLLSALAALLLPLLCSPFHLRVHANGNRRSGSGAGSIRETALDAIACH
jgi:hypothetical protein